MREDLSSLTQRLPRWPPKPLHRLLTQTLILISIVKSRKEESIKAHLCEESRIRVRMAERIDLPTNAWFHAELFEAEFVADLHIVDHVLVVGGRFVVHGPARV